MRMSPLGCAMAAAVVTCLGAATARACPPNRYGGISPIWRFHGPGDGGGCCCTAGVRRFHGLGDGYCYRSPRFHGYGCGHGYGAANGCGPVAQDRYPADHNYWWYDERPPAVIMVPPDGCGHAWWLLSRDDARGALREFAVLALRSMDDAEPKVGFALAAMMLGRTEAAREAMSQALRTDEAAVQRIATERGLESLVRELIRELPADDDEPELTPPPAPVNSA